MVKLVENGEIRFFGMRVLMMHPISACEKIDELFGSGSESIVHHTIFECGSRLEGKRLARERLTKSVCQLETLASL